MTSDDRRPARLRKAKRKERRRRSDWIYCKRELERQGRHTGLALTFDHIIPLSRGGTKKAPCCRASNKLKADTLPQE